jgi:hypothetical protein
MAIKIMQILKSSSGKKENYEFIASPQFDRKSEAELWITKNAGDTTDFLLVGSPKKVKLVKEIKYKVEEEVLDGSDK